MTANPYRGEAPIEIAGEIITLRFTWGVMAELLAQFGDDWDAQLNDALGKTDTKTVADFLAVITGKDASVFMESSPPWLHVQTALNVAYSLALQGVPSPEEAEVSKEERSSEDGPLPSGKSWSAVGRRLMRLVWRRANSGGRRSTKPTPGSEQAARA